MKDSSDHNENPEQAELPKLSFERINLALKPVVDVAIPMHVKCLKQHNENIEALKKEGKNLELRNEQVQATKVVRLLKDDLYRLESLNRQVREEDSDLFHSSIKNATKDAVEILALFLYLHGDIFTPLPETEFEDPNSDRLTPLVCNYKDQIDDTDDTVAVQAQEAITSDVMIVETSKSSFISLKSLQRELLEVNALMKQFSRFIFRQKDSVDTIQDNIEHTKENVLIGTEYLKKASDYKAAAFPIAGALLGGVILGPVGVLAGFKIFGSIACLTGGSVIGYGAGLKLKKRRLAFNEIEMKALTDSNKALSNSSPDLSAAEPKDKDI